MMSNYSIRHWIQQDSDENKNQHSDLSKHYNKTLLTHPNFLDVLKYTANSRHMNKSLIEHVKSGAPLPRTTLDRVTALDTVLSDHRTPKQMSVYHVAGFNPSKYLSKGSGVLHMPAYTSTSIERKHAEDYIDSGPGETHVMHIHVPAGSPGVYIGDHSRFPKEREFLLPRDSKLLVSNKQESYADPESDDASFKVWHARLI